MPGYMSCEKARQNIQRSIEILLKGTMGRNLTFYELTAFEHIAQCQKGLCSSLNAQLQHIAIAQPR